MQRGPIQLPSWPPAPGPARRWRPYFVVARRGRDRAAAARGDQGRGLDRRRHRAGPGHPGLPEPRQEAHRGGLRLPGLDPRRGPRHAHQDRRADHRGQDRAAGPRPAARYEQARAGGEAGRAARAGAPQRLHHERRQRHAGRPDRGRARLLRADRARGGRLRARLPDRGRARATAARRDPGRRTGGSPTRTSPRGSRRRTGSASRPTSRPPSRSRSSPPRRTRSTVSWRSPRAPTWPRGRGGGNKDVVLRWRLAGDTVETGVLLFPGDDRRRMVPGHAASRPPGSVPRPSRRASTSSCSTSRARCTASRSTPPRR